MDTSTLTRLGLAVLGQALPKASALEAHARHAKSAVTYTIISAMLFTSIIVFGLYIVHTLLIAEGMSKIVALIVPAIFGLLIAIIMGQRADKNISRLSEIKTSLSLFPTKKGNPRFLEEVAVSFVQGLNTESSKDTESESAMPTDNHITLIKENN